MSVAISRIGLATAQGSAAEILASEAPHAAKTLPWTPNKWNISRVCYPALEIDSAVAGAERWRLLAGKALVDLGDDSISHQTPLLVASCNGSAAELQTQTWTQAFDTSALLRDTPWANQRLPVFSSSCASGIHALFAAKQLLETRAVNEVLVLAADILSHSNHENFESLRVLAEKPQPPWQSTSTGFLLGEAAVVLKLVRSESASSWISGPMLASDLVDHVGLSDVLESIPLQKPSLVLGQGTGPFQNDTAELSTFSKFIDRDVPVATPLSHFGHTLGASGLLAVALAALKHETTIPTLTSSAASAMDGRPLFNGFASRSDVLTTCRALNGACAATVVGSRFPANEQRRKENWRKSARPGPLMNQTLRQLASEAPKRRPAQAPDVLILRMETPLSPPISAFIGERLLPSAVLEITPGFASQLVARCWGFTGPALCLVGDVDTDVCGLKNALIESGSNVFQVNLRGNGDDRAIEWNA